MRNRITLKGFRKWLMRQKNDRDMECKDAKNCAVAQYLSSVFKTNSTRVYGYKDMIYMKDDRVFVVKSPKIFDDFIKRFDGNEDYTAYGAKIALKQVMQEHQIVDVKH